MYASYEIDKRVSSFGIDVLDIAKSGLEQSRQFGFLRFSSLEDAVSFMDRNYPSIYLYGDSTKAENHSTHAKVRINYGKERKDIREDENDWICSSVRQFLLVLERD